MPKKYGHCALCGKCGELTFEHIPPKSAFNKTPVKPVTVESQYSALGFKQYALCSLAERHGAMVIMQTMQ